MPEKKLNDIPRPLIELFNKGNSALNTGNVDYALTILMQILHAGRYGYQPLVVSASAKNNTLAMMEGAQKNPAAANLVYIPGFLLVGGGVPIKVGNEVIGAVGVGGAPGGHLDEQCAVAGIDKAKELLK